MTNHTLSPTRASEYDDNEIVNLTANAHMDDILAVRLSRRSALKGGVSVTAGALLGGLGLSACGGNDDPVPEASKALALGFTAVAKNLNDLVTVPEGYQVSILHALGDPLHYGDESWKDDGSESAESYNRRVGDGHDGMYFFGLTEDGKYDAARSDRGLLAVNHEYVVQPYGLHPAGITAGAARVAGEVEKEIYAHGVSVVEVKRGTGSDMSMVRGSRFNRRVTSATEMVFTGPAKGSALVRTRFSTDGLKTRGTNNNCANGYTPWGTYLTCEENWLNVVARAAGDNAIALRQGNRWSEPLRPAGEPQEPLPLGHCGQHDDLFARWTSSVTGATAADDYRNDRQHRWLGGRDRPFRPQPPRRPSARRSAASNHEGAWPAPAVVGQPIVMYMGDDARNEYIYKFVSKAVWDADGRQRRHGRRRQVPRRRHAVCRQVQCRRHRANGWN